jgi:hypothetical protein
MKFELRAKHKLAVDGRVFEPGETVATIHTPVEISNVISAAYFGDLKFEAIAALLLDQPPVPADTKRVRRDRQPQPQPEALEPQPEPQQPEVNDELDPDALNAMPDPEPDTEPAEVAKRYEVTGTTTLAGLPERIGRALIDAGLRDRKSVAKFYATNQGFAEVEGIGKAAERKIVAWLEE